MDHLEEAKGLLDLAESGLEEEIRWRQNQAIAHCLLDIAESLRWFKEQMAWEIDNGSLFGQSSEKKVNN